MGSRLLRFIARVFGRCAHLAAAANAISLWLPARSYTALHHAPRAVRLVGQANPKN
jgi:hypothetical protein